MHTTHFTTNGSIQTAFHDTGSGDTASDQTFVLVHGFTGSKLDFHDQLDWFATKYRVIAYDQRGHGESSNTAPYNFYSLTADLIGFLDALEVERCHILGHSLGGMVVMRALLAHPHRFRSAILMDTAPFASKLFSTKARRTLNNIVSENGCIGLLDGMLGQPQSKAIRRGIDYLGEDEYWRRIKVKLDQMDADAFVQLGEVLSEHPSILESMRQIHVPTTIIAGQEDHPFLDAAEQMADTIPNSHLVVIDEAGHSPQYENSELWRETITDHLARFCM